jgi:hypothetical protein
MSMFANGGRVGAKPFEIKVPREHIEKMAKGGLAGQAKNVASAGVGGDTMVIHINKDEYQKLCKEWGEPTINPHTGMPQFTPFYKQSWFAPVAALVGTALMATGVGAGAGTALLGSLGAGEVAGTTLAGLTGIEALGGATVGGLVGNAALGAGIGGLTGGVKGALTGGLLSGAGTVAGSALGNYFGGSPSTGKLEGASGSSTSDMAWLNSSADQNFNSSGIYNISGGTPTSDMAYLNSKVDGSLLPSGTYDAFNAPASAASKSSGLMSGVTDYLSNPNKMAAAAVGIGSMMSGGSEQPAMPTIQPGGPVSTDPNMTRRLATAPLDRTRLTGPIDYYNYGKRPDAQENRFYSDIGQTPVAAARGGPLSSAVNGPGTGRSDSIDAKLSDGEYVIDAETVALLGDGSSKAGAAKLDQFRANIRKQKGKALSQGKISPDAHSPDRYLMGGRA